jgi:hypothetical protein
MKMGELSERDKDTDRQEKEKESKNPDTTRSKRGVWQRKFRSAWRRKKTGVG